MSRTRFNFLAFSFDKLEDESAQFRHLLSDSQFAMWEVRMNTNNFILRINKRPFTARECPSSIEQINFVDY